MLTVAIMMKMPSLRGGLDKEFQEFEMHDSYPTLDLV
jgi:hypothetical protein